MLHRNCAKLVRWRYIYRVLTRTDAETLNKWQREFSHRQPPPLARRPGQPRRPDARQAVENLGRQTELSMEESGRRAGRNARRAGAAGAGAGRAQQRTYRDFLRPVRRLAWSAPRPRGIRPRLLQLRPAHLRQSAVSRAAGKPRGEEKYATSSLWWTPTNPRRASWSRRS